MTPFSEGALGSGIEAAETDNGNLGFLQHGAESAMNIAVPLVLTAAAFSYIKNRFIEKRKS